MRVLGEPVEEFFDAGRRPARHCFDQCDPDLWVRVAGEVGQPVDRSSSAQAEPVQCLAQLCGVTGVTGRRYLPQQDRGGGRRAVEGVRSASAQAL